MAQFPLPGALRHDIFTLCNKKDKTVGFFIGAAVHNFERFDQAANFTVSWHKFDYFN